MKNVPFLTTQAFITDSRMNLMIFSVMFVQEGHLFFKMICIILRMILQII